jgi:hypothetical protein
MRKSFRFILVATLVVSAAPALAQQNSALNGVARGADRAPLANFRVNVRNANTAEVAEATISNQAGQFAFASLLPGNYVVEIVDAAGSTVGLSPAIPLSTGATVTVTVGASAAGALASGGGLSLLGLGPLASVAVGGAGSGVTSVLATRTGKLLVCHRLSESDSQTLEIKDAARDTHMGHGDSLGSCPATARR